MQLYKKIIISGQMECLTGLHIGDTKDSISIGGVDMPVVRRKDNNQPYVPGSSLKGKMRCLLQQYDGEIGFRIEKNESDTCKLFGAQENTIGQDAKIPSHASRIIVRDACLTDEWVKKLDESPFTDMPYTEVKFENTIDRITGTTIPGGIRQTERVPAGAVFKVEFIINVFEEKDKIDEDLKKIEEGLLKTFYRGIGLIENDYLGGSGSRGYGQVRFTLEKPEYRDKQYFESYADKLLAK